MYIRIEITNGGDITEERIELPDSFNCMSTYTVFVMLVGFLNKVFK